MKTQIISIGNELLIGDTINTNASWMANFLTEVGFEVTKIVTIPDQKEIIQNAITDAMHVSDIVFCTGGLGPTHDDITKTAVADLFKSEMIVNEDVLQFVESRFKKMNIPLLQANKDQALVPDCCEVLFNSQGSAPGMWFHENDCYLAVLPGVPQEMKYLMTERVAPKLKEVFEEAEYLHSVYIQTSGIGESTLSDEILGDLSEYFNDDVSLAFLPHIDGVTLRLNAKGESEQVAKQNIQPLYDVINEKAADFIFGEGKDFKIERAVGELLKDKMLMVATAESCTGGLIANTLTNISGSAEYVKGGIVAYENQVKIDHLNVSKEVIAEKGAVSKEVALQMAKGVAEMLEADMGISATGIAGPSGGTPEKPVGTVWIGFYTKDQHFAVHANLSFDRLMNKERTVAISLDIIRRVLLNIDEMPYRLQKHFA